jgi:AGZA family xanthine/uracil permease-like MFS transporter
VCNASPAADTVPALVALGAIATVLSAAGIGAGGRTGLTSIVTAILFILAIFLAPVAGIVPAAATAPALIVVGIMMMSAFRDIKWDILDEAIPAFFAGVFMAICYNISYGIAGGFIFYCIVKFVKGQFEDVHPIIIGSALVFILNFVVLALI